MAEHAIALGLNSVPLVAEHYEKVYDPLKDKTKQGIRKVKEMRDKRSEDHESESEDYEYDGPPARRRTTGGGNKRSDYDRRRRVGRDDVDADGFVIEEKRYAYRGGGERAKSMGRDSRGDTRRGSRRDYSDSESSISPRPRRERRKSLGEKALAALGLTSAGGAAASERSSRGKSRSRRDRSISSDYTTRRRDDRSFGAARSSRSHPDDDNRTPARYKPRGYAGNGDDSDPGGQVARRNINTEVGSRPEGSEKGGENKKKGKISSSESSSDLCSSSEDERRTRKMKGKEYITAGLAAVATIHAAHSVYSSMEARDKRHHEVANGEMTPQVAKKLKNKARLQDVAAIGIAALGIKGAYSEWQEVQENRNELAEQSRHRQERHEKRVKRGMGKYGSQKDGDGASGNGRSRSEGPSRRNRDRDY